MRLHVEVTQADIDDGTCGWPSACMVAKAIHRCSEGVLSPYVMLKGVYLNRADAVTGSHLIRFPGEVSIAINAYDRGKPVAPFAFDLEIGELPT